MYTKIFTVKERICIIAGGPTFQTHISKTTLHTTHTIIYIYPCSSKWNHISWSKCVLVPKQNSAHLQLQHMCPICGGSGANGSVKQPSRSALQAIGCVVLLLSGQWYEMAEESLEVKLPTIWTDGKAEVGRIREEKGRRKKIREEKESEASCFVVPEARKVGSLAKAAGAEPSGQMRNEKLRAIVARSTFSSQNV